MATDERIEVESTVFACDGGGGAFGHPRVYLRLGEDRTSKCPYCGRHFVLKRETAS
ncbi:MAG: zinc-finger domain-containing protein [Alphaproteobacteria bacterium]|nr:zinc-finger domain-containing protein [Alphaproteobacteria bacterium]HJM60974.1 zinc-finger domain-containing protein [Alphaproteobacteria bacterium]